MSPSEVVLPRPVRWSSAQWSKARLAPTVRDVTEQMRDVSLDAVAALRQASANARRSVVDTLPPEAGTELVRSVRRVAMARTPRQATTALEQESERLLGVLTPILVEHPLPVRRVAVARTVVATAGGLAAASEEIEELAALFSAGASVPPTLPVAIAGNLAALAVELWVAASVRTHALRAAGHDPDAATVAGDVLAAMAGGNAEAVGRARLGRRVGRHLARRAATRVLSRWAAGFIPFVGIAYSSWDAQRTVDAVLAIPLPAAPMPELT